MAIYSKPAKEMLVDLINESNPNLPFEINGTDYDFTTPTAIADPGNGHNTELRIIAKPSAPYTGNIVVTYRRLNLAYLFRGITPMVRQWVPNSGSSTSTYNRNTFYQLMPLFTKKYGVLFEQSQFQDYTLQERHGIDPDMRFTIAAKSDSWAYVGNIQAQWVIGKRTLADLLQVDEVAGRQYPSGNDFSAEAVRKLYLTPMTYNTDFTMYDQENAYWDSYGSLQMSPYHKHPASVQYSVYRDLLSTLLLEQYGLRLMEAQSYTSPIVEANVGTVESPIIEKRVGLYTTYAKVVPLPSVAYPEANTEFFNTAIVIDLPDDCGWATGTIFLHYNR